MCMRAYVCVYYTHLLYCKTFVYDLKIFTKRYIILYILLLLSQICSWIKIFFFFFFNILDAYI